MVAGCSASLTGAAGATDPYLANSAGTLSKEYGATCCPGCKRDPDAKAIALLNWLKPAHPDRFSDTRLRTLQRRVQQWRGTMAKKLVYAAVDESVPELPAMPELALVGAGPKVLKLQ